MTTSSSSHVWQTHHQDSEATINCQIKLELYASCVYLSMSYYFDPYYAALKNFAIYFLHHSHWEKEHAEKLIKLRNQHSGCIFLQDIKKPDQEDWESGLNAMECAVYVEKKVSQSLLELHKMTNDQNDPHVYVFLKTHYLDQKVKSIKQLSDHLTNVRKMPPTHSPSPHSVRTEYLFDKHTLGDSDNES